MRLALTLLLATTLLSAVQAQTSPKRASTKAKPSSVRRLDGYEQTWQTASRLRLSNPVTQNQADLLARAYFYAHISGCCGSQTPKDMGAYWLVPTRQGIGASLGPSIRIEKRTGVTSSVGYPTVKDPKSYAKLISK
ncbi:hypothetical protein BH11ARM2_BH11ARM2_12630 [soil metagenome]